MPRFCTAHWKLDSKTHCFWTWFSPTTPTATRARAKKAQKKKKPINRLLIRGVLIPLVWWPYRESNPSYRRERAMSWPLDHRALYCRRTETRRRFLLVAAVGLEPTTNRVWTEYSSQLSYAAKCLIIITDYQAICNCLMPYKQKYFRNLFQYFGN